MSVIPDSTFRGLETQFADMSFTTYRPPSLTSSSAPSDMTGGCWEDNGGRGRGLFTGQDDNERDGASMLFMHYYENVCLLFFEYRTSYG